MAQISLPPEILKKVKLLELSTRKLVNNQFSGEYHTHFKGQGMTFSDFREYVPGDDVRSISWSVTARTGKTHIKKYDEERELTLILAVDVSGSSDFGTGSYFKGEIMTHLAALLAFVAVKNKDQVGLLLFSDQIEHYVPPRKGRGQVLRILRDLYYYKPRSAGTKMMVAFQYLQGILKKRASIFVMSDFYDENYESSLRLLGRKHEVVAVLVNDKAELQIPNLGLIEMEDLETGELKTFDTSSKIFKKEMELITKEKRERRDKCLRQAQVARVDISSEGDYVDPLMEFFRRKRR